MIYIDTEGKEPPREWLAESDALTKELIRLHQAGDTAARNKLIDDNSAHWGEIKAWLSSLSHGKCWFSEAKDIYSHLDVEHFRPKKEAKNLEGIARDGYWWLAFDYHNYRLCGTVGNRKKGGWFPLQSGSRQSTYDLQCEESEEPYLLDPTNPVDVTLIVFDEEGMARPAETDGDAWNHKRANLTIERLKFNEHEALTEERKKIWEETSRDIDGFLSAMQRSNRGGNPGARATAEHCARSLKNRIKPDAELSAVARQCIQFRNDVSLIRLCN
jgi:uncharacterized protein (TIGR02646 family)